MILFLMTTAAAAQESSARLRPGLHLKSDKPSRSKEQRDYDKALDSSYRSSLKDIRDENKTDPWGYPLDAPSGSQEQAVIQTRQHGDASAGSGSGADEQSFQTNTNLKYGS
jgi:hypothetical protein